MAKLISETDFLPQVKDIQRDLYQLLYGMLVIRGEGQVYDSIITLCRTHRENVLRQAKINYWKSNVQQVLDKLYGYADEADCQVYVPYLGLRCDVQKMIHIYSFGLSVLEQASGKPMEELQRRDNKESKDIKDFFPIPYIDDIMFSSIPRLQRQFPDIDKDRLYKIIDGELIRRRICRKTSSSSISGEDLYKNTFLGDESLAQMVNPSSDDEERTMHKDEDGVSLIMKTGVLYFMLKHFMETARNSKKQYLDKDIDKATRLIAFGLFDPFKPYDSSNPSNTSLYQYVYHKKFCNKNTSDEVIKHLKDILIKFKISMPQELQEEIKRRRL